MSMIKKRYRIKKNKEFRRVYDKGRSTAGKFVVIYLAPNGCDYNRFGYSVSSKVGKAVTRNRVKRILREICRKHAERLKKGYDIIFIARPRIKGIPYALVEENVVTLWKQVRLWK